MKKINRKRIDVLNKKGISVLAIGIVLFSVLVSAIPVMAAGEITAMRDISNQAVNLGDTVTVTVTVTANQEIEALALDEDLPDGWEVTRVSDDAAAFKESTTEWIWTERLSAEVSKTVIYNVTVPSDAEEGTYYITGKVSAYKVNPIAVGGETEVNVIGNLPPIANFTYTPENPVVNQPVTFDASSSYDLDGGNITEYWWNVSGAIYTTQKFNHTFTNPSEKYVFLQVKDEEGDTNSTVKWINVAPSNVTIQVAVLVLIQDNPTKIEKGMIELLKELGFSPEVTGIDRVERGAVKLSQYRVIVVPTYSLDIDNALKSEKVKEAIINATNSGTNWILFNSGSKVLEVLGLATTKINPPPGWIPALPDSHYVVNATTDSPITAGVPMMPDWPGGYTLQELYTLMLDPLIWRVDNTESSRYKWLNIDEIIKEPTYLIYKGSTGWEIGKPHKELPEWVIGGSRILYYRHFWNADPGNGGGGTVGLAGKIILKNAIEYYGNLTGPVTPVFEDDFSEFNLDTWIPFGSPSPRVLPSAEGRDGVFDNNGDGWCNSGAVSKKNFSFPNGFTMESDMFLRVTDVTGCWNDAIIGITRQNTPTGEGVCPSESYPLGVYIGIFYTGDACWATPVEKRRHAYFRAALYAEDGTSESVGYDLSADDYINGWHNYKIVVGSDRYVKFYVDGDLIYASKKKLHPDVLNKKKIFLGVRSSDSAGKSYHDVIKVYTVEKEQQPPIANFTYYPEKPVVNQTITFNASSSYDPDGTIVSYEWNFGDGNVTNTTEETKTINYSYSEAGSYEVTLTVTDDDGATNSISNPITVLGEATTLSITPPTQEVLSNESFIVNVTVDPAVPIAGVQFDLSFNSSLVAANSVTEGNLLSQGGADTYFSPGTIDNTAGTITGVAGAITTPGQTVSSPGVFATIHMTAQSVEGTSLLDLSNVIVGDINGNPVSVIVSNGSVTVTTYPDWDVNRDGHVNVLDMIRVGQHWGETGTPHWVREDVNSDGSVNVLDMILIGQHWTG